jgi:hypothetical protein
VLIRDALVYFMRTLPSYVGTDRPISATSEGLMCFAFGFEQLVQAIEACDDPYDIDPEPELMFFLHHVDARLSQYAWEPDQLHFESLMDWVSRAIHAFPYLVDLSDTGLGRRGST